MNSRYLRAVTLRSKTKAMAFAGAGDSSGLAQKIKPASDKAVDLNNASVKLQNKMVNDVKRALTPMVQAAKKYTDEVHKLQKEIEGILSASSDRIDGPLAKLVSTASYSCHQAEATLAAIIKKGREYGV